MAVSPQTYDNILTKGLKSQLASTSIEDGKLRFCTDTGELFLDNGSSRVQICDINSGYTEQQLANILVPLPQVYLTSDTHRLYVYAGGVWYDIGDIRLSAIPAADHDDKILWFSDTDAESPLYDSDLKYNAYTKTLTSQKMKVGNMLISTTSTNEADTVDFEFV
jgi:hypothetical protein